MNRYDLVTDDDHVVIVEVDWDDEGKPRVFTLHKSQWGPGGGVPASVWLNHTARWRVEAAPADDLLEWLTAGEAADLIRRVRAGYERRWDGNNHVAGFSADAGRAMEDLDRLFEQRLYPQFEADDGAYYTAFDWFQFDTPTVTVEETDDELLARAEQYEKEALADGKVVDGIYEYLVGLRDEILLEEER